MATTNLMEMHMPRNAHMPHNPQENKAFALKAEYHLRLAMLALAAILVLLGAAMVFMVPDASQQSGWTIHLPHTSVVITRASSGIVFGTMGMLLGLATLTRKIG